MEWTKKEPTKPGYYWKVDTDFPSEINVVRVFFVTQKNPWTQEEECVIDIQERSVFTSSYRPGEVYWSDEEVPYPKFTNKMYQEVSNE